VSLKTPLPPPKFCRGLKLCAPAVESQAAKETRYEWWNRSAVDFDICGCGDTRMVAQFAVPAARVAASRKAGLTVSQSIAGFSCPGLSEQPAGFVVWGETAVFERKLAQFTWPPWQFKGGSVESGAPGTGASGGGRGHEGTSLSAGCCEPEAVGPGGGG